jgi:hypothetical protein
MFRMAALATLLLLSSGCAAPARPHYPSAVELGHCPFGHTRLRDVPIVYGLLSPNTEVDRRLKDLELWYGGCVISEDSPRRKVVCPDCGYCYEAEERVWSKSADSPAALAMPLSDVVTGVPAPEGAVKSYHQMVTTTGLMIYERVYYYCHRVTPLDIASRINAHVQQCHRIRLEGTASQYPAGTSLNVRGRRDEDGWIVKYHLECERDPDKVTVDFVLSRPDFEPKWYDDLDERAREIQSQDRAGKAQ